MRSNSSKVSGRLSSAEGKPKAVLDQVLLAGPVAPVHTADLGNGDVALVDDHESIVWQIVDQRGRRLARVASGQMARVVFDALAETQLGEHLQIEARALLDALSFQELALALEELDALAQLGLDGFDRPQRGAARSHVVAGRVHGIAWHLAEDVAGERVEQRQLLHLVVEQADPYSDFGVLRGKHVQYVPAHPERSAAEFQLVALILHLGQALDDLALAAALTAAQVQDHAVVVDRIADPVDAGYRCDDHSVGALEQRFGRRQPHLLDVLVDARVLLDIQVAGRDIGLGLIVVVVGDEVLHRIVGKELSHLRIQLRRQRLVGRQNQRRPAEPGDHVGHGVGLARAGHSEQGLERQAVLDPFDQLVDGLGLVSGRRKRLMQLERAARENQCAGRLRRSGCKDGRCHGVRRKDGHFPTATYCPPAPTRHRSRIGPCVQRLQPNYASPPR